MNDTNSNIEIINFDYSVNDEQNQNESGSYPHENFNKDYLNLYLMEKSGLDNEQNDSLDIYQPSFSYTNQPNDSFSSYYSNDGLSCFSESLTLNPPNPLNNETCDKSFCASVITVMVMIVLSRLSKGKALPVALKTVKRSTSRKKI
jgi:hypothetical protein